MTVQDAANQLHVTELEILRGINRGLFKGGRLGTAGPWVVEAESFAQFVARGAPGFGMPKVDGEQWFTGQWYRGTAELFADTIAKASEPDAVGPEGAQRLVDQNPRHTSFDVPIRKTPAVVEALQAKPPQSAFSPKRDNEWLAAHFASWAELFLTVRLRDAAARVIGDRKRFLIPPLRQLYAGPGEYRAIVDEAIARVRQQQIAWRESHPAKNDSGHIVSVDVFHVMRLAEIGTPAVMQRVEQLAF